MERRFHSIKNRFIILIALSRKEINMASHIKLDKAGLEGVKGQVVQAKDQYDTAMQTLKTVINNLQDVLEGDAQQAMYNRYKDNEKTFEMFSEEIGRYIQFMDKTIQELPGKDIDTANMIRGMARL
jgi:uncharacterized protein YukE